jgi:hypothetical protein
LADGVALIAPRAEPLIGNGSGGLKVIRSRFAKDRLLIDADAVLSRPNTFRVKTNRKLTLVDGGTFSRDSDGSYEVRLAKSAGADDSGATYTPVHLELQFLSH